MGPSPGKTHSKRHPNDPNGPPPSFGNEGGSHTHRMPQNREETDQYGWWMGGGKPKRGSMSQRGGKPGYPPPPLPWQVDPENNPQADFGNNYKEWYDKQAGVPQENKGPDLPKSVPGQVSDMVKKHMELVKKQLSKYYILPFILTSSIDDRDNKVKTEMKKVKEDIIDKDRERSIALHELQDLKLKLKNQTLDEDVRHNYMYHILFKNWKAREKGIKNGDLERKPYQHVFPDLEKVDFRLPENFRVDEMLGDNKGKLDFINYDYRPSEHDVYTIKNDVEDQVDVELNNIDRLNKVNKKRLFDIDKNLPRSSTPDYDELDSNLFSFLDKESVFRVEPGAPLGEKEARNELYNKDILKDYDPIDADQYKTPITVFDRIDTSYSS